MGCESSKNFKKTNNEFRRIKSLDDREKLDTYELGMVKSEG
jgi:hypothetical protein